MPLLQVYESLAGFWTRTSPHRSSSATVYLPIWHADVRKFVVGRTNRASDASRFRHLFPALWIPDLLYVIQSSFLFVMSDRGLGMRRPSFSACNVWKPGKCGASSTPQTFNR